MSYKSSAFFHTVLVRLSWIIIRSLIFTLRYEFKGPCLLSKNKHNPKPFIFAIWHEHIIGFLSAHAWTEPVLTMASKSQDGDFAAHMAFKMGYVPVRGSSRKKNVDKGGKEALEEYLEKLALGIKGGITVDGPRGPRHVCKMGIAKIAQKSGCAIIPGTSVATRYWTINSWDKFKIPKPFSKVVIRYGEPIWVSENATDDELMEICRVVERELTAQEMKS